MPIEEKMTIDERRKYLRIRQPSHREASRQERTPDCWTKGSR